MAVKKKPAAKPRTRKPAVKADPAPQPSLLGPWGLFAIAGALLCQPVISAVLAPAPAPVVIVEPDPPVPPPVVQTLRELAGEDAPALAALHQGLADSIYAGNVTTAASFRAAYAMLADGYAGNPAMPVIQGRIDAALEGVVSLDPGPRADLVECLRGVADELGSDPVPPGPEPVPVSGPRHVVILYETEDRTPDFGVLLTELRDGDAAKYLADKGHKLDVLDDDETADTKELLERLRITGATSPALFVLDAETGAVLSAAPLPDSAAGVLAQIKKAGG